MEVFHDTATECHLPYGITQCYLIQVNPSHTGRYSIYLPRRDRRLSWRSWLDSTPAGIRTSEFSISSPTLNHCTTRQHVIRPNISVLCNAARLGRRRSSRERRQSRDHIRTRSRNRSRESPRRRRPYYQPSTARRHSSDRRRRYSDRLRRSRSRSPIRSRLRSKWSSRSRSRSRSPARQQSDSVPHNDRTSPLPTKSHSKSPPPKMISVVSSVPPASEGIYLIVVIALGHVVPTKLEFKNPT